jgi:hypothetical protein
MPHLVDIINVVSVTAPANVNHWIEENDDEIQEGLYWRQALHYPSLELSVRSTWSIMSVRLLIITIRQFRKLANVGSPQILTKSSLGVPRKAAGPGYIASV